MEILYILALFCMVCIFPLPLSIYLALYHWKALRRALSDRRAVRNWIVNLSKLSITPIKNVGEGLVRLEGQVEVDEPLISPIHGSPCAAYGVEVRRLWRTDALFEDRDGVPLRLKDDTGTTLIEIDGTADFEFRRRPMMWQWLGARFPERVFTWLNDSTPNAMTLFPRPTTRAVEWLLEPGDQCTVIGEVVRQEASGQETGYRQIAAVSVVSHGDDTVLVADEPGEKLLPKLRKELRSLLAQILFSIAGLPLAIIAFTSYLGMFLVAVFAGGDDFVLYLLWASGIGLPTSLLCMMIAGLARISSRRGG